MRGERLPVGCHVHLAAGRLTGIQRWHRPGRRLLAVLGVGLLATAACTRPVDETVAVSGPVLTTPATPATLSSSTSSTTSTASTTSVPASVETTSPAPDPSACVSALPLDWRAGQVLMPAAYADSLGEVESLVDTFSIGGVVLMTWSTDADAGRLRALRTRSPVPLLIATDEEGGNVQRLRSLGAMPSQRDVAASSTPADAEALVAAHASVVADLGIDLVLGPVVDVGSAAPIGRRSFSEDPTVVSDFAKAYVEAWRSVGITPVIKHFPGHGRASADTHQRRASTPHLNELDTVEFVPYRALAAVPGVAVMVGHLDTPGLTDGDGPASLSPAAIDTLRRLGYEDAIVVTDALDMGAVPLDLPDAAVAAIVAGADIALFTGTSRTGEVHAALVDAVASGRLPSDRLDEAVLRLLARKGVDPCTM